jgi:hypothetical protein
VSGAGGQLGGSGGAAGDCSAGNSASMCDTRAEGWFAIKVALDVWWQGTPIRDPGRGDLVLTMLARVGDVCGGENAATAELKVCGVQLPLATSEVGCEVYELSFDDAIWDRPSMPRFLTSMEQVMLSPGATMALAPWVGLLGLDLLDSSGPLPTEEQLDTFACTNDVGTACFHDHDQDGHPGLTLRTRNDQATFVGPYGDGKCSSGREYRFFGLPVTVDITAAGGNYPHRAAEIYVGMRTHAGIAARVAPNCASATGTSSSLWFDLLGTNCTVDSSSLHDMDPRHGSGDFSCDDYERGFIASTVPAYRILQAGEAPDATMPPLGWVMAGRDIPKDPSHGPRSGVMYIADLAEAEPSCATARATIFPIETP